MNFGCDEYEKKIVFPDVCPKCKKKFEKISSEIFQEGEELVKEYTLKCGHTFEAFRDKMDDYDYDEFDLHDEDSDEGDLDDEDQDDEDLEDE